MKWIFSTALALFGPAAFAGLLVTEVAGNAEIEGKGLVVTLAEIQDGALVNVPTGAQVIAVDLGSGLEYVLKGGGHYIVTARGPNSADGKAIEAKPLPVKNLPNVRGTRIAADSVAQASLVMRSTQKDKVPLLVSPVRTAVISETPVFLWNAVADVSGYRLSISNRAGETIWEVPTHETEMALPADHKLLPGEHYQWRVAAIGDGGTLSDASATFWVIQADAMTRLARLKPGADAPLGRRVLYAIQLQEAGALAEAKQLWKTLSHERPDDAVIRSLAE
jgi:hypothetical protein